MIEKKEKKKDLIILFSIGIHEYLKCLFLSDEQEQDVVLGMIRERSYLLPNIGAVWELSVAGKDPQVKLAGQKAYLEQSEFISTTSRQQQSS